MATDIRHIKKDVVSQNGNCDTICNCQKDARAFRFIVRQALLMIVRWIEKRDGLTTE